jgi:argininosuccinate synthase
VGQGGDLEALRKRALAAGAAESIVVDAQEEFAQDFILPALQSNALYEGKYPLVSALSRPLIAKHLVATAQRFRAPYVAHGCTGKGNDQVRLELSIAALAPEIKVLAPVREKAMSRDEAINYAQEKNIPIEVTEEKPYSVDENLWGRTVECGLLEDPSLEPPDDAFLITARPQEAPDEPSYVEIDFENGCPVALNGQKRALPSLISELGKIAGSNGFGRVDMIENRLVGIKSREVYEVPAALSLIKAHEDLESLVLERDVFHFKKYLEVKLAELIYYGQWYSPLREAIQAFIERTQKDLDGQVKLKFYKGTCQVVGRTSPNSLYDLSLATYEGAKDAFSHQFAQGFIELFGLPLKVWARRFGRRSNKSH